MKILSLLFTLSLSLASEYSVLNYQTNYKQARHKALKEDKLLILLVVKDSCRWCHKLARKTLLDPDVQHTINQHYLPLILNSDHDPIPTLYRCSLAPVIYFIDPKEDESFYRGRGFYTPLAFLQLMHKAWLSHLADLKDAAD